MSNHPPADRDQSAHSFREELPIYAAALAIGVDADAAVPGIAAHLASCPYCAAELRELLELVQPAYAGAFVPAARYPAVDLTFLHVPTSPPQPSVPVWRFEAGRLSIYVPNLLLPS